MRYVISRLYENKQEMTYRFYVTDSLKCAFSLKNRYYDVIKADFENTSATISNETRTGDEIIADMKAKMNNMFGNNREEEKEDGE